MKKITLGKQTASVQNYLMMHNKTKPEEGKGCTVLAWTDRYAYEVLRVSKDGTKVIVQQYVPERINVQGAVESESQQYKYEKLNGVDKYIVFKWGSWRWEIKKIVYTEKGRMLPPLERKKLLDESTSELKLVAGLTRIQNEYPMVNILWGAKEAYFDYSF